VDGKRPAVPPDHGRAVAVIGVRRWRQLLGDHPTGRPPTIEDMTGGRAERDLRIQDRHRVHEHMGERVGERIRSGGKVRHPARVQLNGAEGDAIGDQLASLSGSRVPAHSIRA
jgi:hypothetical protein